MPTTDRPDLDDPRVLALAIARQQLAHEGVLAPTWDELTDEEQESSLPSARSYLWAAIRAGLFAETRAAAFREAADLIEETQHEADDLAAYDHGALTDTETAAHIAVRRRAKLLRAKADEIAPAAAEEPQA